MSAVGTPLLLVEGISTENSVLKFVQHKSNLLWPLEMTDQDLMRYNYKVSLNLSRPGLPKTQRACAMKFNTPGKSFSNHAKQPHDVGYPLDKSSKLFSNLAIFSHIKVEVYAAYCITNCKHDRFTGSRAAYFTSREQSMIFGKYKEV